MPAISRYERDRFLDAYCSLFGPLDHFVRTWKKRSVLLSLAANTSLLSGASHVDFLLRSRENQRQDRCLHRMLRRRHFL
jgi:hypothetical protein